MRSGLHETDNILSSIASALPTDFLMELNRGAPQSVVATLTQRMAKGDEEAFVIAQTSQPNGIPVRYLTDEEPLARFPGQPVGLVGSGSSREFMVLANARSD